jgi:hypothetical protein
MSKPQKVKENHCPKCGADLCGHYGEPFLDEYDMGIPVKCPACSFSGVEWSKTVFWGYTSGSWEDGYMFTPEGLE